VNVKDKTLFIEDRMTHTSDLNQIIERLRLAMKVAGGDLELAVKSVLSKHPEDAQLLQEIIAGAQASQERSALDPEIRSWLQQAASSPRIRHLASTLSGIGQGRSHAIIAGIAQSRPDLAEALKNAVFQFDDLEFADKKGLQTLVRTIERETLLLSLRGLDGPVKKRLLKSLSDRNAKDVLDELEWMKPVRRSKVDQARDDLVQKARNLLERGEMFLMRPDDPDPYIE
jgi:flagellar motor switch protein FliG